MIGKIERVPLRDIWKHEAYDFTSWLQDNIDVLNDALGLSLSNPEREQSAGSFNVGIGTLRATYIGELTSAGCGSISFSRILAGGRGRENN